MTSIFCSSPYSPSKMALQPSLPAFSYYIWLPHVLPSFPGSFFIPRLIALTPAKPFHCRSEWICCSCFFWCSPENIWLSGHITGARWASCPQTLTSPSPRGCFQSILLTAFPGIAPAEVQDPPYRVCKGQRDWGRGHPAIITVKWRTSYIWLKELL